MSAALFDPDGIMREVRAKANLSPLAKTANLLKNGFSSLAKLARPSEINRERDERAPLNAPDRWSEHLYEFLLRPRPEGTSIERWACAWRGVEQFARGWAASAMSLGWSFDDLFAFAEPFANMSLQGAAWFVGDSTVTAVTTDAITLRIEDGGSSVSIGSHGFEEAATMSAESNGTEGPAPSSAGALRMRRHRERRRRTMRCMFIELREAEVAALILGGLLTEETQNDTRAVKTAFYEFLDRTLGSMR
jgi:hypothetical protein